MPTCVLAIEYNHLMTKITFEENGVTATYTNGTPNECLQYYLDALPDFITSNCNTWYLPIILDDAKANLCPDDFTVLMQTIQSKAQPMTAG
jgi:hypothetical protein